MKSATVLGASAERERVMIRLLLLANYAERDAMVQHRRIPLPAGAAHVSRETLARLAMRTVDQIDGDLKYLVAAGFCTKTPAPGNAGLIIQVCKWSDYQAVEQKSRQADSWREVEILWTDLLDFVQQKLQLLIMQDNLTTIQSTLD